MLVGLMLLTLCQNGDSAKCPKSNLKKPAKQNLKFLSGKAKNNDEIYQEFLRDRMNRYGNSKAYSLLTRIGKRTKLAYM